MKRFFKFACIALVLCVLVLCFASCSQSPLQKAVQNGDDYKIVCAYDETAHALSAVQTMTLTNRTENTFTSAKFHLYANQYRQDATHSVVPSTYTAIAYPNGQSFGDITIDSAKVNGNAVAFSIEGEDMDILCVPTQAEWFPGDTLQLELTYVVTLANIKHRLGYTENCVNLGNFFPILCHVENGSYSCTPYYAVGDPFVSECANYTFSIKVAEDFVVACSGNLAEANAENGYVTYHYTADAVRDFALVLSKNYKKLSQTTNGITVNYFYFADDQAETSLATAVGALEYYSQNIGNYPYKQLSVCETDFCYGGMEYPCLVMVTSGSQSYNEAIAHEVAHQWFYATVGNNQIEHAWMDEGLAEYLTYLYLDSTGTESLSKFVMQNLRTYTTYVDVLKNYYQTVDTTFRSVANFKNDNEYVVMTYVKGSLLFNTLHETMGKNKFFRALATYYNEAAFTIAPPSQMINCFARVGGNEIATVFQNFAEGKEILGKVTD